MISITNEEAEKILKDKYLYHRIVNNINKYLVGEQLTIKSIFLQLNKIYVKNLRGTKCVKVDGESSAGKNFITEKVFDIFPDNKKIFRTRISPRAFDYWNMNRKDDWNWDNFILFIDQVGDDLLNSETFKLMVSEGSKTTIVMKNQAVDIEVKGKPVLIITTCQATPNNEIINRFDTINLDESDKQTSDIIKHQAKEAELGRIEYDEDYMKLKSAMSRLLPINVKISYATLLEHFIGNKSLRMRRVFPRFIDLIKSSCALHQMQRKKDDFGYYYANRQDYEIAREVIEKTKRSTVIGLSHQLKRAYEGCVRFTEKKESIEKDDPFVVDKGWWTVNEIYSEDGGSSLPTWYNHVQQLFERKLLESKYDYADEKRFNKTHFYRAVEVKDKIRFPEWSELMKLADWREVEQSNEVEEEYGQLYDNE